MAVVQVLHKVTFLLYWNNWTRINIYRELTFLCHGKNIEFTAEKLKDSFYFRENVLLFFGKEGLQKSSKFDPKSEGLLDFGWVRGVDSMEMYKEGWQIGCYKM